MAVGLLAWGLMAGSLGCAGEDRVGRIIEAEGSVERDHAPSIQRWSAAGVDDSLRLGDGIRTGPGASARVEIAGGTVLRLGPSSMVRFLEADPSSQAVPLDAAIATDAGSLELEPTDEAVEGQIERGSIVRLGAEGPEAQGGEGVRFRIVVGQASIVRRGEQVRAIDEGGRFEIAIGRPRLVPRGARPSEPEAPLPTSDLPIRLAVRGSGAELRGAEGDAWQPLEPGERGVEAASLLRVSGGAEVDVRRGEELVTLRGEAQARLGGASGELVMATRGHISASAGASQTAVRTPGGVIIVREQSAAAVQVDAEGEARVQTRRGRVEVRGAEGSATLGVGQMARVGASGRIHEPAPVSRADFVIPAGEAATIHDPAPPTRLGIDVSEICPTRAVVELHDFSFSALQAVVASSEHALLSVPAGAHRYRVYCMDGEAQSEEVVARGSIVVQADPARQALPNRPPRNTVDADGRRYTLLYQNLKPILTFRWPAAPAAQGFTLHLRPESGAAITQQVDRAEHTFRSGEVREGSYRFHFEGGGRRSPTSTLRLSFDRDAGTAYLSAPNDGEARPGATVQLAGAALAGAAVSVSGVEVSTDPQFRFDTEIVAPTETDAIALRVGHRAAGIHYYLRRLAGVQR
ncbi:MAG: FecR family protein [Myxococcales bacterium]|nr:FecR family protein [Myxococcales bacterium]